MRHIIQRDELGCGVTCVAMLAGRAYAEVRRTMFPDVEVTGTTAPVLRDHLELLGCKARARRILGRSPVRDSHRFPNCHDLQDGVCMLARRHTFQIAF